MEDFIEFYKQQADVIIHEEAISNFALKFIEEHTLAYNNYIEPVQFPLQFPSIQEEFNLVAMKELLMVSM